jgi:hypothetical protein
MNILKGLTFHNSAAWAVIYNYEIALESVHLALYVQNTTEGSDNDNESKKPNNE